MIIRTSLIVALDVNCLFCYI